MCGVRLCTLVNGIEKKRLAFRYTDRLEIYGDYGKHYQLIESGIKQIRQDFSGLFSDIEEIIQYIVNNTYFESEEYFSSRVYKPSGESSGVYFYEAKQLRRGRIAEQGSHFKGLPHLGVLYHEWGHALHHALALKEMVPYEYHRYSKVVREAVAISCERTIISREYYLPVHKKAASIIERLETSWNYRRMPLAEKVLFILQNRTLKELEASADEYLSECGFVDKLLGRLF